MKRKFDDDNVRAGMLVGSAQDVVAIRDQRPRHDGQPQQWWTVPVADLVDTQICVTADTPKGPVTVRVMTMAGQPKDANEVEKGLFHLMLQAGRMPQVAVVRPSELPDWTGFANDPDNNGVFYAD